MKHTTNNRGLRRGASLIALAGVLGLAAIGLTQCRMAENIAGIDVHSNRVDARAQCVRNCDDVHKADRTAEYARHKAEDKKCGRDKNCSKAEDKRHKDIMKKLEDAKKDCKKKCYNEGGGKGGR